MQQLTIEHKSNNQKIVSEKQTKVKDRREMRGRVLAISRRVVRLLNSDTYYVESETNDNIYYFVRYNPSVLEWCSCLDNSTRHLKCKHLHAIEFSIRFGTLKDIKKLPTEAKRYSPVIESPTKSYRNEKYDF